MLTGALHELPSKVTALSPTATQKDADGHDTECKPAGSTLVGALHELPLKVTALPLKSTAMQNDDEGQETEARGRVSMLAGALHELPSKVATSPGPWSAAMQKVAEGHDTDLPKKTGSTRTGADQPVDANACDGPTSISSPTIPPTKAAYRRDCLAGPRREAGLPICPSSFRLQATTAKSSRTLITARAQSRRSGRGLVDKLISRSFLPPLL